MRGLRRRMPVRSRAFTTGKRDNLSKVHYHCVLLALHAAQPICGQQNSFDGAESSGHTPHRTRQYEP